MVQDFAGLVVVVTGGAGALGLAVVRELLERGAVCHATWRSNHELERVPHHQRLHLHQIDCTDESAVIDFYRQVGPLWASIHTIGGFTAASVEKTTADDLLRMFNINTLSSFLCCREAIDAIRKTGRGGRIVNISARPAVTPTPNLIAYTIAKSAVAAMTQSLAQEVRSDRIWVNAVLPSIMDTPANRQSMPEADFSRWPRVEQVAQSILYLAGPANELISGALVPVYGAA